MLKLCELYPDDSVIQITEIFMRAFINRLTKITLDIAQNQVLSNAQVSDDKGG